MNHIIRNSINVGIALLSIASATAVSASDYQLWREQVSINQNQTIGTITIGARGGSSFLDAIPGNLLPGAQESAAFVEQQQRYLGSAYSGQGNWFLEAVSPKSYGNES